MCCLFVGRNGFPSVIVMFNGRVAVSGANGFVGRALVSALARAGWEVRPVVRILGGNDVIAGGDQRVAVGDIGFETDWSAALRCADTVIHLAARVHVMRDAAAAPLAAYRDVNTNGTLNLASQAAASGVKRFLYLSSIKVNGEATQPDMPFTGGEIPAPIDPYGISKREAEDGLRKIGEETGMEVVIIRPPLVYGPGVKANFRSMMQWLQRGVPLPLGAIHNRRSLVALDNLIDLIVTCIAHPSAANQIFLAGDGEDLSTTDLLRRLGVALNKPARLVPVPPWLLEAGAAVLGKQDIARRLCGSLQVDISKARTILGWNPPVGVDDALRATARHFLKNSAP
jgi:nucleoside-diphosphate-sugar epimerase